MKKIILLLLLMSIIPVVSFGADSVLDKTNWSLEVKGGNFAPALDNWAQYYSKRSMPEYGGSLAYKLFRQLELGVEGGYIKGEGHAFAPLHSQQAGTAVYAGSVTYELLPLNVFILARGIINENQWVVPYIGGGFTRMYYREKVEGQDMTKGSADGTHVRGGLQFLLDGIDRDAANSMYMDYGVFHTYFFIEAEKTSATVKAVSVQLGGTAYTAGMLFEF